MLRVTSFVRGPILDLLRALLLATSPQTILDSAIA